MFKSLTTHFEEYDRRIFWAVVWCTVGLVFLYIYFLGTSVYSVIARKQAEAESADLLSRISLLEQRYVELDKDINLELAHKGGFVDVSVPRYLTREGVRDTFTLRDPGAR